MKYNKKKQHKYKTIYISDKFKFKKIIAMLMKIIIIVFNIFINIILLIIHHC
jgi:hypothetical protein